MGKIVFLVIFILVLLIICSPIFAQDTGLKFAVLPFDNNTGTEDYEFLSTSLQSSIYSSLERISPDRFSILSIQKTNASVNELGLSIKDIDNMVMQKQLVILKFFIIFNL